MLSRIAEALYWMGRYLERADDTARLLDVYVHRLAEMGTPGRGLGHTLVGAMGLDPHAFDDDDIDLWRATELLAYDTTNPSSVAGSLQFARANAAGLRETLPSDVWEVVNRTYHDLAPQIEAARVLGPHRFLQWVRNQVALVGGLIDSELLHDDGWRFLTVGRNLERIDMTARLLAAVPADADSSRWSGVLGSCGANDAFLRLHGGTVDRPRALGVLVLDRDFPRSVWSALVAVESCLRAIEATPALDRPLRAVTLAGSVPDTEFEAVRKIGRLRSELEFESPAELDADLAGVLDRLQSHCSEAGSLIAQRYFRRAGFVEWSEGVGA